MSLALLQDATGMDVHSEEWRAIEGYADYEVSSFGRIRNVKRGTLLKPSFSRQGYLKVCLSGADRRSHTVHKLVAQAWHGPRPEGLQIDHLDGHKINNTPANLRYVTLQENIQANVDRRAHPFGSRHGFSKLTESQVAQLREIAAGAKYYWGAKEIAQELGVDVATVRRAANKQSFGLTLDPDISDDHIRARFPVEQQEAAILGFRMAESIYRRSLTSPIGDKA